MTFSGFAKLSTLSGNNLRIFFSIKQRVKKYICLILEGKPRYYPCRIQLLLQALIK